MKAYDKYLFWLENDYFDDVTKEELASIKDNMEEIEERFYRDLEFGTAGLRGIIGAGTNRINKYIVRKVSQGIANYINKKGSNAAARGIVIAYDSRHKSPEFAMEAALVFAGNGIGAWLFDELRPVPVLSFTIRYLKAAAGIAITASHNPKEYNGYKVYGEDGAQLLPDESDLLLNEIDMIKDFSQVKIMEQGKALQTGLLQIIGKEIDDRYIDVLKTYCLNPDIICKQSDTFKIIYTPLNGAGNKPVRRILNEIGFKNVFVVKEQEEPNPDFPTVKTPNPEDESVFKIALEMAKRNDADLIIGTDPDSDRVGIMAKDNNGSYTSFTGNQIGCLMLEYILSQKSLKGSLPSNGFIVKTIVTTELAKAIAKKYHIKVVEVLTGFKFIGEKIRLLDENGDKKYLLGFEESYGYLAGTYARDKDAVSAAMIIAEMAAYYKSLGKTLMEVFEEIYGNYGFTDVEVISFTLEGKEGLEQIQSIMEKLRKDSNLKLDGYEIYAIRDYLTGERYVLKSGEREDLGLPESNVLYYELDDESWFCIRPSGTEPKIKIYIEVFGNDKTHAAEKLKDLNGKVLDILNKCCSI
ncbi:MAG TPA: phospho-sugar mutase [Clostridiales bacterium]|nr:phospho-sugar mutase [Clostridiales bacterium]